MDLETAKFNGMTLREFIEKIASCAGFVQELGKALSGHVDKRDKDGFLLSVMLPKLLLDNAYNGICHIMEVRTEELKAEALKEKGDPAPFPVTPSGTRS